jgi:uncharacterized protein YlxP (DUF503 family)
MNLAIIALVLVTFEINGCRSLKEKRGILLLFIHQVRKNFKPSVATMDLQDSHPGGDRLRTS